VSAGDPAAAIGRARVAAAEGRAVLFACVGRSFRRSERSWFRTLAIIVLICGASAASGEAQTFAIRGTAVGGLRTFTAADSFKAIVGSSAGPIFGGGIEVVLPQHVFVSLQATRFRKTGERVFLFEGQQFDLGIPATITVTPVELSVGYRFDRGDAVRPPRVPQPRRLIPYVGGGVGWHRYEETSEFATGDENVKERKIGYHLLGGAEYRVNRWLGIAGEGGWSIVPDALGQDPNGVSAEFDETDLGGGAVRFKLVIGR
jgi:opacity protein-like surface antigen